MRFSSKSRAACFCCFFSDLLIWLNLYDDQIACQCWCRQSANTWHTKLKSGASNLHGAGASNLQDNNTYLADIDRQAQERFQRLIESMKQAQGITERLKEENALEWVQHLNNIRACARETVNKEIIYN